MDIIINEPLTKYASKLYQGQRWRYPSMTDVKFISDDYIIAAHRYGCKVYVIHIHDDSTFRIVNSLTMTYNGKPLQTESFVIVNNTIYMLSYSNVLTLLDIHSDYVLEQRCSIVLGDKDVPLHGIAVKNNSVYITPSKKTLGTEYILCYDISTGAIRRITSLGKDIRVKSLTFLDNDLVVVVVNYKTSTSMVDEGHIINGSIRLYTSDFHLVDSVEVPFTHFDGITCNHNEFYATGADLHGGYIYKGVVEGNKIVSVNKHQVNDFPHGIVIKNNKIGYTSYATSGVHIINANSLVNPVAISQH